MTDHQIRAYGPNYHTSHLCVDLDDKVRAISGATILIFGDDPAMRAMQARALSDSLGLKLMKNPIKAATQHNPEGGVTVALHAADAIVSAHTLVHDWVLSAEVMGPRVLIVETTEGAEVATSVLDTCALFVKVEGMDIPPAGIGSGTMAHSEVAGPRVPTLCPGVHRYAGLFDADDSARRRRSVRDFGAEYAELPIPLARARWVD